MSLQLRSLVASQLGGALRRLLVDVHPDRFHGDATICRANTAALATLNVLIPAFCAAITDGLPRLPPSSAAGATITLYKRLGGADVRMIEHQLAPCHGAWQGQAISLFHLFSKADIEVDARIRRAVVGQLAALSAPQPAPPDAPFGGLLRAHLGTHEQRPFDRREAGRVLSRLECVRICPALDPSSAARALDSVWRARGVLWSLQQRLPHASILITDRDEEEALGGEEPAVHYGSGRAPSVQYCLPPSFSAADVLALLFSS